MYPAAGEASGGGGSFGAAADEPRPEPKGWPSRERAGGRAGAERGEQRLLHPSDARPVAMVKRRAIAATIPLVPPSITGNQTHGGSRGFAKTERFKNKSPLVDK